MRLCRSVVIFPLSLTFIVAWTASDELLTQLQLDYSALQAAEADYRAQREFNSLEGTEAADYAAFIAGLQRRVFESCWLVVRSGSPFPEGLPCPVILPQVTESADISTEEEQTLEEQVAALDSKLAGGLGDYDERLLREQERIEAATPNTNPDGGEGAGGAGEAQSGGETDAQDGDQNAGSASSGSDGAEDEGGQSTNGPADSSAGSGTKGTDKDQPADIPDGSDDDIVARQLREAAEQETDPELKAKLWEEYRRYKQGTG